MGARADAASRPAASAAARDLGERGLEVGLRLGHRLADAGDDLDRALEQLVLGLRVLAVGMVARPSRSRISVAALASSRGVAVDELQLDLDAEARARGAVEVDAARAGRYPSHAGQRTAPEARPQSNSAGRAIRRGGRQAEVGPRRGRRDPAPGRAHEEALAG